MHRQHDDGRMGGFFTTAQLDNGDGNQAMPYYTEREIPFYYSLFENSGLCANYFCSLLGRLADEVEVLHHRHRRCRYRRQQQRRRLLDGAPAPPRDGDGRISDLYDLFEFD